MTPRLIRRGLISLSILATLVSPAGADLSPAASTPGASRPVECRDDGLPRVDLLGEGAAQQRWRTGNRLQQRAEASEGGVSFSAPAGGQANFFAFQPVSQVIAGHEGGHRLEMTLHLRGWDDLRYVAVGWIDRRGGWHHARIKHFPQDQPTRISMGPGSIAVLLNEDWVKRSAEPLEAVRIIVSGTPGKDASLEVLEATLQLLPASARPALLDLPGPLDDKSCFQAWYSALKQRQLGPPVAELLNRLDLSQETNPEVGAEAFFQRGEYSLTDLSPIAGDPFAWLPSGVEEFTTSRYRWHSLSFVRSLLDAYDSKAEAKYLYVAAQHADRWLQDNFLTASEDPKYAWYDHGTAERSLVLLDLWTRGIDHGFDPLFMNRLWVALWRHGELLASPAFYARNQPMRHHNHAIFQDLALLALEGGLRGAVPAHWSELAGRRLGEQFAHLVTSEGASVENSYGYHKGLARVCHAAVDLLVSIGKSDDADSLGGTCNSMDEFTAAVGYPDGTAPSLGDTWRSGNESRAGRPGTVPDDQLLILPTSGYAVATAAPRPGSNLPGWQLNVFNTDLSITHKHGDNLSFTLWADNWEWLIDPGYHSYGDEGHAALGRLPAAHNTVVVEGADMPLHTDFAELWGASSVDGLPIIVGRHRGYPGIEVKRTFIIDREGGLLYLSDELGLEVGRSRPPGAEVWFHAGDLTVVQPAGDGVMVLFPADGVVGQSANRARGLAVVPLWDADCDLFVGSAEPLAGWYYPAFAQAKPAPAWKCKVPAGESSWTSVLVFDPPPLGSRRKVAELKRRLQAGIPRIEN